MRRYDVKCPACGTVNYHLYLQETAGFMECEKCGTLSQHSFLIKMEPLIRNHVGPHESAAESEVA